MASSAPDLEHHPFEYTSTCEQCGEPAEQAAWERNLLKAHANATGPKTPEGIAATAKNLEGHPTPEEAKLTRFNAMKHGLYAKSASFFPAKPGQYPDCENCEHLETRSCFDPPRACFKRMEIMLKHRIAFETKDPGLLTELRADTQASVQVMIDWMILAIAQDGGPRIKEIQWYHDKDGKFYLAKWTDDYGEEHQIYELKAHPLAKILMDYISKNAMTLSDMGMTPKVQDEQDTMRGFLNRESENQEALDDHMTRQLEGQRRLEALINSSYSPRDAVTLDGEVIQDD